MCTAILTAGYHCTRALIIEQFYLFHFKSLALLKKKSGHNAAHTHTHTLGLWTLHAKFQYTLSLATANKEEEACAEEWLV